jgi:hypothetical protein
MKNLLAYKLFETEGEPIRKLFDRFQISWLDKYTTGSWKYNPLTGKIDVNGSFDCSNQGLADFKGVEFGEVKDQFRCYGNKLTSLEGSPKKVNDFVCGRNLLKNLIGGPVEVNTYHAVENELISMEGSPVRVNGSMSVRDNLLESLVGSPEYVKDGFNCSDNKLVSIDGAPKNIGGDFNCSDNYLENLIGVPNNIGGKIILYGNNISSLRGIDDLEILGRLDDHSSWFSENPLSRATAVRIIDEMTENNLKYGDALRKIWADISDEDKVMLYKDLSGLTDKEAKAYASLEGFLKIRNLL